MHLSKSIPFSNYHLIPILIFLLKYIPRPFYFTLFSSHNTIWVNLALVNNFLIFPPL